MSVNVFFFWRTFLFNMHSTSPQDLGNLWAGSIASPQPVPAGKTAHFDNALCVLYLSDSPAVNVNAVNFHAHLLVRCRWFLMIRFALSALL